MWRHQQPHPKTQPQQFLQLHISMNGNESTLIICLSSQFIKLALLEIAGMARYRKEIQTVHTFINSILAWFKMDTSWLLQPLLQVIQVLWISTTSNKSLPHAHFWILFSLKMILLSLMQRSVIFFTRPWYRRERYRMSSGMSITCITQLANTVARTSTARRTVTKIVNVLH